MTTGTPNEMADGQQDMPFTQSQVPSGDEPMPGTEHDVLTNQDAQAEQAQQGMNEQGAAHGGTVQLDGELRDNAETVRNIQEEN